MTPAPTPQQPVSPPHREGRGQKRSKEHGSATHNPGKRPRQGGG